VSRTNGAQPGGGTRQTGWVVFSALPTTTPVSVTTNSRHHTAQVGALLAGLVRPGDVVILSGELGAGKTAFSGGFIKALGSDEPVTSPTFTIMREHALPGGGCVLHLDAYRLESPHDAEDIGLLELLDRGAIAILEWGERIVGALGPDLLMVRLAHADNDAQADDAQDDDADDNTGTRLIEVAGYGSRWAGVSIAEVLMPC
jgi:tRNA threonylcarbamoyladenosine biosynthesis protein TsaE